LDSLLFDCTEMLRQLGLSHVPLETCLPSEGANKLLRIYETAPPCGVNLLLTGTCTEAAEFARGNLTLFREKTQRIILMGGVIVKSDPSSGNTILEPDAAAQNNRKDLESARELFRIAQEQSVPMVIMSRHVAQACNLPRLFFEAVASHGGSLGQIMVGVLKRGIQELWRNVNRPDGVVGRGGLPDRCNREWFHRTFCSPTSVLPDEGEDVWQAVGAFRVYSALGLCAALPSLAEDCLNPMRVSVRSATHHVLGISRENHGVKDPNRLRSLLYQCIFKGLRLNASEYNLTAPPAIPLSFEVAGQEGPMWEFDGSEDALAWLMPTSVLN